ncbi:fibropellin-3 [Patella vulgata]|uniref:fibropellin-3 n=1 Tax=Patella vulgata TaxID=6465 RepID=UPI00218011D8|nr:fibropellin-3 [Patella vulgata]
MRVILSIALILTTVATLCGAMCESCCKVSACTPNPCKNNGTCTPPENEYRCSCTPGYVGQNCDVNVCLPNPCENNGTCSPVDKGYICNCTTGYFGKLCDVNPCDISNPCINNGRCYPSEFGVNCSCPSGFIGEFCQDSEKITLVVKDSEGATPVEEVRECNVTECKAIGGMCVIQKCHTDGTNCDGKACNTDKSEICVNDTCIFIGDYCGTIDDIYNACAPIGESCGDGEFCTRYDKCVNDTCRLTDACAFNSSVCSYRNVHGTCSGGVCLAPCKEGKDCGGRPCVGGYCAVPKCGESYCRL